MRSLNINPQSFDIQCWETPVDEEDLSLREVTVRLGSGEETSGYLKACEIEKIGKGFMGLAKEVEAAAKAQAKKEKAKKA